MIKISDDHRQIIQGILEGYKREKFNTTLKQLSDILKEYYDLSSKMIGKRLFESLFSTWLSKPDEAIVHYYVTCKLINEYGYPSEHIGHEVSCGGLGRSALKENTGGSTFADVVVYTHDTRRPGTALIAVGQKWGQVYY